MNKRNTLVSFLDSSGKAIREPWKYKTSHVSISLVLLTGGALIRIQPSIPKFSPPFVLLLGFLFLASLLAICFAWFHATNKIIAALRTRPAKYLTYVSSNLIWVFPNYVVIDLFAPDPIPALGPAAFRISFTLFLLQILWTSISNQINRELVAKEALVEELSAQRAMIIDADEATRELVSRYLHNNLQSGLVVITHQLRESVKNLPISARSKIQSIADELEIMREVEIRDASKALSPNLDVLTTKALLSPLVEMYLKTMEVKIEDNSIDYPVVRPISLAIYRICEQVLLNAAAHGHATQVKISLSIYSSSKLVLTIQNNGQPLRSKNYVAGTGSAIIDTWVSSLNGSWGLQTSSNNETRFEAQLSIPN